MAATAGSRRRASRLDGLVFAARVLLGGVFVLSALLKLRDPGWPAAARAFGTPASLVPVVPWTELVVGLLVAAQLWPGVVAATVLLVVFTAGVALHLARGERVPCACFGQASPRPIGPGTLVRNGALLGIALVALL